MNTCAAESTPVPFAGMCLTPFAASISGPPSAHPLAIRMLVENLARAVVHPVVASRSDVAGLQLAALLEQNHHMC
jgi:hypothetical protein